MNNTRNIGYFICPAVKADHVVAQGITRQTTSTRDATDTRGNRPPQLSLELAANLGPARRKDENPS
ncbi:hypothetical protein [Mycobacterium marinum]|uniref:hypothetical protein n=1 Tax=Mycobacterium marinum TaxID=1781 RepID=UPI0035624F4C